VTIYQSTAILALKLLLTFALSIVALPSFSSVKIACPCKLSMDSGSSAFLEYSLIFTEEITRKEGLQILLIHSDTLGLYTSNKSYDIVGSSEIQSIVYSADVVMLESPISLENIESLGAGFLGVVLKDSDGKTIDFFNLGLSKVFWDSSGSNIPNQGLVSIDTMANDDADHIPDFLEIALGSSEDVVQMTGNSEIEVLFTYATGAKTTEPDIAARIAHIMAVANLSLSSSSVRARLKSLGSLDLGDDAGLDADNVLDQFADRSGLWTQFDNQISRKPDLVIHLSSLASLGGDIAGMAWLLGSLGDGVYDYQNTYSRQNNLGVVAVNGGDRTLIHEIGHLMGLTHSAQQGASNGSFYWSRGYGVEDQFVTLMAYKSVFGDAIEVNSFSSTDYNCLNASACGVEIENTLAGANAAKSLSITALQVAAVSNGFSPYFEGLSATNVVSVVSEHAIGVEGVRAIDPEDGDISSLVQSSFYASQIEPTTFNFVQTLTVSDSDGNTSVVERKVLVLVDTDSDGLFNHQDEDDDNDGYLDKNDSFPLNFLEWSDFDGDGLGDNSDMDDDNDGANDSNDVFPLDAEFSLDSDGDGIADKYELRFGYNPTVIDDTTLDYDGDGLSLLHEFKNRTFPSRADSDRDTLSDKWEVDNGHDPLTPYTQVDGEKYTVCTRVDSDVTCEGIYDDRKSFQQRVVDYSVGNAGSQCAVLDGGELSCWGPYSNDLIAAAPLVFDAVQVALGDGLACYINQDASIKCWGNVQFDISQFNDMELPRDLIAKGESICALGDRSVSCWGAMGNIKITSTELLSAAALGSSHGCASFEGSSITSSIEGSSSINVLGNNICWGKSQFESLSVPTADVFSSLAIGSLNSCGTISDGIICWGWDYTDFLDAPSNLKNAILGAGNASVCALTLDRGIGCWGDEDYGGVAPQILIDPDGDGFTSQGGIDVFPLDTSEWLDTDLDGIGNNADSDDDNDGVTDNSDVYPLNNLYSADSDGDGMPNAWEAKYGLDPNDASDASSDQDNDGVSAYEEFIAGTIPSGSLDLDGNGQYDALTDGLLLLRGMFGLSEGALISGAVASDAIYTSSSEIVSRIDMLGDLVDIDGNDRVDALTDGLIILRYLFGLRGDVLINGVIASDATITSADGVGAKMEGLMPAL